jgi:hypothetical protein
MVTFNQFVSCLHVKSLRGSTLILGRERSWNAPKSKKNHRFFWRVPNSSSESVEPLPKKGGGHSCKFTIIHSNETREILLCKDKKDTWKVQELEKNCKNLLWWETNYCIDDAAEALWRTSQAPTGKTVARATHSRTLTDRDTHIARGHRRRVKPSRTTLSRALTDQTHTSQDDTEDDVCTQWAKFRRSNSPFRC